MWIVSMNGKRMMMCYHGGAIMTEYANVAGKLNLTTSKKKKFRMKNPSVTIQADMTVGDGKMMTKNESFSQQTINNAGFPSINRVPRLK